MRRRHDLVLRRRHLRDGEPQFGRARRHDRARPPYAAADPRPPQRLGRLTRHPPLGWSYAAWQKIWRLAGADHMHVNGLGNKFCEADDSVIASARACLTPMFEDKPCTVMPVFSSGQSAGRPSDLSRTRVDRPDLRRRRRHHGSSRWAGGRGRRSARGWDAAISGQAPQRAMTGAPASSRRPARRILRRRLHRLVRRDGGPHLRRPADGAVPRAADAGAPCGLRASAASASPASARSKDPAWMDRHLPPVFGRSPASARRSRTTRSARPSIPRRMSARSGGRSTWRCPSRRRWHPLVVGAPAMGRYQAFGHLFAAVTASATGSTGTRPCRAIR